MERTVVALFDDLETAQNAVQELLNNGFSRDNISVVRTNQQGDYMSGDVAADETSGAAAGAGIGAVLGGLAGLLVGLGALAIPGIGPIIAAGPLATTLAGAGLGAAAGGLIGALTDVGIPEDEAGQYAEGVRRGGTLVTVGASEAQVSQATAILNRHSPVDVNERATEWRSSGWSGFDTASGPHSASTGAPHTEPYTGTRDTESFRASTGMTGEGSGGTYEGTGSAGYTGSGTTYQGSEGEIETHRGTYGTQGQDFTSGTGEGSMEGPLGGHQGSLAGGKTFTEDTAGTGMGTTGMTFRSGSRSFQDFDRDFRSDWESRYRNSGFGYERYQPAYQYGWQLGERYQGRNWNEFETDVRNEWERSRPNDAWADFKDAVRRGWDRFTSGAEDVARDIRQGAQDTGRDFDRGMDRMGDKMRDAGRDFDRTTDRMGDEMRDTGSDIRRGFDYYDNDFRSDWERSYRSSGYDYERYQPAYQYGYSLASDNRYRGRDWRDVEADVRRDWQARHPNDAWEDFKDAVQHAWRRVRSEVRDTLD